MILTPFTQTNTLYFLVESIFMVSVTFFVLSTIIFVESVTTVVTLSVFTVVDSVVDDPDPQAANRPTNVTVNNFFILIV
jgi:hypothetical protein